MNIQSIRQSSLEPFDNLALIRRYFAAVKTMDRSAVAGKSFDVDAILSLWGPGGTLVVRGPEPIGERTFKGLKELRKFYVNRARGVDGAFAENLSQIGVANAKASDQVLASGKRYVVTKNGEGMQVPFAHKFTLSGGKVAALEISVGKAEPTEIAPLGNLEVQDMGRLAAMAWMVA